MLMLGLVGLLMAQGALQPLDLSYVILLAIALGVALYVAIYYSARGFFFSLITFSSILFILEIVAGAVAGVLRRDTRAA